MAIFIEEYPSATPASLKNKLIQSIEELQNVGWDEETGYGLILALMNEPPTVEIFYPKEGEILLWQPEYYTFYGTSEDPYGGEIHYVIIELESWTKKPTSVDFSKNEYLSWGPHTISAQSYDGKYYSNIKSVNFTVKFITTEPGMDDILISNTKLKEIFSNNILFENLS